MMTTFIRDVAKAFLTVLGFVLGILPVLLVNIGYPFAGLALLGVNLAVAALILGTQ